MSDVSSNFRTFLLAGSGKPESIGQRVHGDHVPQDTVPKTGPFKDFIWYSRRQAQGMETLDSSAGEVARVFYYDIECVSMVKRNARAIADWVRARCNCYRGTYGDSTVQGIFVDDQDADYEPQSIGGDRGAFVEIMNVRVFT